MTLNPRHIGIVWKKVAYKATNGTGERGNKCMDAVMVNPRLSLPLRWRRLETQRQPTTGLTPTLDSLAVLCSHNQSGCLPVHRLAPTHKHLLMSGILLKHFQTAALMLCVMLRICVRHNLGFLFGPRSLNIVP